MSRHVWLTFLLVALPAFGCSEAQERSVQPPAAQEERLTLEFQDADLRVLVELLQGDLPANLVVDPNVQETVSIRLEDVHWRDALERIAQEAHCVLVEERGHGVFRFIQPPSGGIEFRDADLRVALELLARYAGEDVTVSRDVQGNVSFTLLHPATQAAATLGRLLDQNGLAIVRDATKSGEIVRIVRTP